MTSRDYPVTPDGRYFLVGGRLWRATNPAIAGPERDALVGALMDARRAVKKAKRGNGDLAQARAAVNAAKIALGERGPIWWADSAPEIATLPSIRPTLRGLSLCVATNNREKLMPKEPALLL